MCEVRAYHPSPPSVAGCSFLCLSNVSHGQNYTGADAKSTLSANDFLLYQSPRCIKDAALVNIKYINGLEMITKLLQQIST